MIIQILKEIEYHRYSIDNLWLSTNITDTYRDIRELCGDIPILLFENFNKYSDYNEYRERLENFIFERF